MYGVWIDRQKARIFRFEGGRIHALAEFGATGGESEFFDVGLGNPLFQQLAGKLKSAEKLIFLGPGIAKHHLRIYLIEQYPAVGRKLVAMQEVDASAEFEAENIFRQILADMA